MKSYDYKDETRDVKGKVRRCQKSKMKWFLRTKSRISILINKCEWPILILPNVIDWKT